MKAIILAAGIGSRFSKFTETSPKCLLPIGNETLLGREIRILNELGFSDSDIIIMGGYKSKQLVGYAGQLIVNEKYQITDNSYTLGMALKDLSEDVIIMDGDLVFEKKVITQIIEFPHRNVVLTKIQTDTDESTGIELREDGSISAIGKNIKNSGFVYISIFKVSKEAIIDFKNELLAERSVKTWYTAPLTAILNKHKFYNCVTDYQWHEIDCPEDYTETAKMFGFEEVKF